MRGLPASFFETFLTRIFNVSSVSVLLTRWFRPRQIPSSFAKSGWCMMRFSCSLSFSSICAIMASIVLMTSSPMTTESARACSALSLPCMKSDSSLPKAVCIRPMKGSIG